MWTTARGAFSTAREEFIQSAFHYYREKAVVIVLASSRTTTRTAFVSHINLP
jgi:hypothetical protein